MAGSVDKLNVSQWASDILHGYEPATEQGLVEVAQALSITRDDAASVIGRLRDDDARPSAVELRDAKAWLRATTAPTAALFRRHAEEAVTARASLRTELGNHAGIDKATADDAYRNVLAFAAKYPALSLRAVVDAYILILRALPVDAPPEGRTGRVWQSTLDTIGRGHTDNALSGTQTAFTVSTMQDQSMQLAARIYASVLAYSSPEIAATTTERILGALHHQYPAVPINDLVDSWLALQATTRTNRGAEVAFANIKAVAGEQPPAGITAWMRAYATIYRAEDDAGDTLAVLQVIAKAPEHLRKNPEALATTYTALLQVDHDVSSDALRALNVLQRWCPPELEMATLLRTYVALRNVADSREALARTLYLIEKAGSPLRPQALQRLTDLEIAKARDAHTVLGRLSGGVRELPGRLLGWWERPTRPDAPKPKPKPPAASIPGAPRPPQQTGPGAPPATEPEAPEDEEIFEEEAPKPADPHPVTGRLPTPVAPAQTPEGLAIYAPASMYRAGSPECIDLFERAAVLAGLPKGWAKSEGLHRILFKESRNGIVGIPNYTYGTNLSIDDWRRIHTDLKGGTIRAKSSATGLGQLLLRNVDVYYPAGRDGIGVPLQEAAGMLAYIKDRYGTPDNAWAQYGKRHEGY